MPTATQLKQLSAGISVSVVLVFLVSRDLPAQAWAVEVMMLVLAAGLYAWAKFVEPEGR